ncbi:Transcriptional regulator MraZ [Polystyrenella longa]|uniref:Transcriptional regulator MraZ n=1 Tax=Polystyrenella longa TaxID=2528007 RepID=A0A518CNQ1_9PLAN|nr:cell division protein [Polystyrenella longa]QDU80852.1 Transcriptional regulator MraZ [Polystyrenella longa]
MALTGSYGRSFDEKHRFALPKKFREILCPTESEIVIAPGTETSLSIYSLTEFERIGQKLTEKSTNRRETLTYLRIFYSQAEHLTLDSQGRVRLPERLVKFAQMKPKGELMLLGVHDHCEIWDRELWDQFLQRHAADFDDMATQAFE